MWFSFLVLGDSLKDGPIVCFDDASFRTMIEHSKKGLLHVYVEHKVDIPHFADEDQTSEDTNIMCESRVGGTCEDKGGGPDSCIGETSNVGGSHQMMTDQGDLFDVKINAFKKVGDYRNEVGGCSNETVDLTNIEIYVDGETEDESENGSSSDTKGEECLKFYDKQKHEKLLSDDVHVEHIFEDATTIETSNVRANKGKEEKHKINRDNGTRDDTDYIHSSDVGSYDNKEDAEVVCKKSKKVFYDPFEPIPYLDLELIFTSTRHFKDALVNYILAKRFNYKLVRNESDKVSAKCKGQGCAWEIYASIDSSDGFFKVKKLINQHDCSITFKNSKANYKFIGKHLLGKLRVIPKLTLQEMQRLTKEELHVDVPINLYSKAMMWAKDEINGRFTYEFDRLFDYAAALRQVDPNCNVDLMVVRPTLNHHKIFKRIYICIGATKEGFRKYCRPIVNLDDCFLKGPFNGELLSTVGRDANDQIYPIAWAVVEWETRETWRWFLENLKTDLHLGDGAGFTIISHMQKVNVIN
ncbi:hypothetical protein GQ457_09G021940 [Hibiscus cannabinus]